MNRAERRRMRAGRNLAEIRDRLDDGRPSGAVQRPGSGVHTRPTDDDTPSGTHRRPVDPDGREREPRRPRAGWLKKAAGTVGRVGLALGTGGASELAIAAGRPIAKGVRKLVMKRREDGRRIVEDDTGAPLHRPGHWRGKPPVHPYDAGPPAPLDGRPWIERRQAARRLAHLHGPVLPHPAAPLVLHPEPGRLHVGRRAAARFRAGLPPRKL